MAKRSGKAKSKASTKPGGAGVTARKQARRDAETITKLERLVVAARAIEEKRRRQLERALEAVQVAEAYLAEGRALIDMHTVSEATADGSASSTPATPSVAARKAKATTGTTAAAAPPSAGAPSVTPVEPPPPAANPPAARAPKATTSSGTTRPAARVAAAPRSAPRSRRSPRSGADSGGSS